MAKKIEHKASVLAVEGGRVRVMLVQQSACAGCQARSMCMSSESKMKEVWALPLEPMKVGDEVIVSVSERLAWKAVALAYGLPLVVMLAALSLMKIWLSDAVAGTITLVVLSLYYMVLSLCKDKLGREFDFTAKRINE